MLDALVDVVAVEARRGQAPEGDPQRAQGLAGERLVDLPDRGAPGVVEPPDRVADLLVRAARQQHVRRALAEDHQILATLRIGMDRGHELALGREGNLAHAAEARVQVGVLQAGLARGHDQGALGGIALDAPAAVVLLQHRVVGAVSDRERALQLAAQRPVDLTGRPGAG